MRKVLGLLLIIIGLTVVFYPQIEKKAFDRDQQRLIDSFAQLGDTELLEQASVNADDTVTSETDGAELLDGAKGMLSIDKIDLEMLIFEGTTPKSLGKGVGMIEPNKEIGVNNIGIAGHRAIAKGKQFNRLDELAVDDEIQVTTQDGTYDFVIVDSFVIHESDVSVLDDQAEPLLTLVTCTPLGSRNPPDRLIVQAQLKE